MAAAYRVHRLIQDLMRDPAAAAEFARDPQPAFERYGLTAEERAALAEGSPQALIALGVHPNLQMKYVRLRAPAAPTGPGPLAAWLEQLTRSG